jgi:hypothetical protein
MAIIPKCSVAKHDYRDARFEPFSAVKIHVEVFWVKTEAAWT